MKKPSKLVIATTLHYVFLAVMLTIIWINVHWSVAILNTWIAITISGFASAFNKFRHRMVKSVKALDQKQNETTAEFNRFIETINGQAAAVKKEMNVCRECEMHGKHGIRPGSVHNKSAHNCLMK